MDNILEQIQSLTDKFNNLFEVEGLGDPSGDVPPSTNKIKKDKKTKDGKVELVSVEDELFPKEGNAKEQFRQKIIDKINGMIQGTATLEDLLQLVRSKQVKPVKEGFEGAVELAEDLYNYIKKKHGEPEYKGSTSEPANKSAELIHKSEEAKGKEYDQEKEKNPDINLYNKRYQTKNTKGEKETEHRSSKHRKFSDDWRLPKTDDEKAKGSIRRNAEKNIKHLDSKIKKASNEFDKLYLKKQFDPSINLHPAAHKEGNLRIERDKQKARLASVKEAQEILEEIINEVSNKTVERALNKSGDKVVLGLMGKIPNDYKNIKQYKELSNLANKRAEKHGEKVEQDPDTGWHKHVKEGFEGAIEILEEIINEVSERTKIDAYKKRANQSKLVGDIAKDTAKWYMDKGAYEPAIEVLKKADTAQKKEFKHRLNTMHHDKAFGQDAYNKAEKELRDEWKAKKDVKEALELMEEIINEVSVGALARATENNFKKRQEAHKKSTENLKKAYDSYEEQSRKHPEDEPALYNAVSKLGSATRKEGEKASHANDLANLNLPRNSKVSANKLFGKADKTYTKRGKEVDKALDKGKGRGDKEFDAPMKKYSRAVDLAVADPVVSRRTNGGANESFEQAISQIEGLINCLGESKSAIELSSVAKRVLPQREEEAKKAHASLDSVMHVNPYSMLNGKLSQKQRDNIANALNRAERADNKVAKAKSYLEKPKEKQSSGIRFDKILCNLEEAMDIIEATVGKLATSSVKSVEPRRKEYQDLTSKAQKATGADKVMLNAKAQKAQKRYAHALELNTLHLPKDSKVPANKLFKAADKSVEGRKRQGSHKRYARAWNIADANPVKTNEGLFVNDGRGDLIDDISKCLTKKTVKQHVIDTAKKIIKKKEK